MNIRQAINLKPIEMLSAIMMIIIGLYLSGTAPSGGTMVVLGNILSAFGGALLSYSTVSLTSKESASEILNPQLSAIARQLVTVSGQISKSVNDARDGDLDKGVALEMISQASRILYASVNEIHVVLNQRVDAQDLYDTAQRVEELAAKLAGTHLADQDEVESELYKAVADLKTKVQAIAPVNQSKKNIPKVAPHEQEAVDVDCPLCHQKTAIKIGKPFGSSAMPTCAGCNKRFHAHRSHGDAVLVKLPGGCAN